MGLDPPCDLCPARCCRYVSAKIAPPRSATAIDRIRRCLDHDNIRVFVDWSGGWYVEFLTPCRNLSRNRCSDYARRPKLCRVHGTYGVATCEYFESPYRHLWETTRDFDRWLSRKRRRSGTRSQVTVIPCGTTHGGQY